jgi:hypothetical protein
MRPRPPAPALRAALAGVALALPAALLAQASPVPRPAGPTTGPGDMAAMLRRTQLVLPPMGWRVGAMVEVVPSTDAASGSTPGFPAAQGLVRTQLRVGFPTYRRGLYRTVVTNEVAIDQYAMDYDGARQGAASCPPIGNGVCPSGTGAPAASRYFSVQHELLASHAVNDRWRVNGILFSAVHTSDLARIRGEAFQFQGGAFLTRTWRPTLQLGAGVLAINVFPYVIPTVRFVHVGRKWRTDVLIPRGETFYEVTPKFEVGGQFRFFGNRWDMNDEVPALRGRTTMTFTHVGPAFNWRPTKHLTVTGDGGILLRRFRVDGDAPWATGTLPPAQGLGLVTTRTGRYDPDAGGYARLRTTWFF